MLGTVTADHDEQRAVETLLEFRCEALILLGTDHSAADLQALAATTPVVLIGRRAAAPNLDVVRSADNQGLEQVVDHPVGLGHRRIAHIDGGAGAISVDRRRGYRTAMRRHGQGVETRIIPGDSEEDGWRYPGAGQVDPPSRTSTLLPPRAWPPPPPRRARRRAATGGAPVWPGTQPRQSKQVASTLFVAWLPACVDQNGDGFTATRPVLGDA